MASRSYFDVVAALASGETLAYANLNRDEQQHVRSLKAEAFVKSVAKNGKTVLLNHPSALIKLTADGEAYASLLAEAGLILAAAPQPEAEKVGRHAKPESSPYAEIDARIAAREQAVKPVTRRKTKKSSRKAGPVTTRKTAPKGQGPRMVMAPQDLDALRRLAAVLPQIDSFTAQYIK